ncbi:hypothetical protein SETIT_7G239400v2 [Setaria italica]|uniref:Uncharacterized protein n=1 Tax=Setaria italica TaxID=4555 RepID=A0A368RZ24_SETIT|nr:hypothetical protein SETIT_7G239400v2 [Setaria italica]
MRSCRRPRRLLVKFGLRVAYSAPIWWFLIWHLVLSYSRGWSWSAAYCPTLQAKLAPKPKILLSSASTPPEKERNGVDRGGHAPGRGVRDARRGVRARAPALPRARGRGPRVRTRSHPCTVRRLTPRLRRRASLPGRDRACACDLGRAVARGHGKGAAVGRVHRRRVLRGARGPRRRAGGAGGGGGGGVDGQGRRRRHPVPGVLGGSVDCEPVRAHGKGGFSVGDAAAAAATAGAGRRA